jgi:hypothetical protein
MAEDAVADARIAIVMAEQRARGLGDVHVARLTATGFVLAHTDEERAAGRNDGTCPVHIWLSEHDPEFPPEKPGLWAVVPHQADLYSEPYGAEPYDLHRLDG